MMKTTIQTNENNELVALFEGRLDTAAAADTLQYLQPLYDSVDQNIVLDCSKLDYISSSGLRLFLGVLKSAKPKGLHVYITAINADLRNIFAMTGFNNLFEFK